MELPNFREVVGADSTEVEWTDGGAEEVEGAEGREGRKGLRRGDDNG